MATSPTKRIRCQRCRRSVMSRTSKTHCASCRRLMGVLCAARHNEKHVDMTPEQLAEIEKRIAYYTERASQKRPLFPYRESRNER